MIFLLFDDLYCRLFATATIASVHQCEVWIVFWAWREKHANNRIANPAGSRQIVLFCFATKEATPRRPNRVRVVQFDNKALTLTTNRGSANPSPISTKKNILGVEKS